MRARSSGLRARSSCLNEATTTHLEQLDGDAAAERSPRDRLEIAKGLHYKFFSRLTWTPASYAISDAPRSYPGALCPIHVLTLPIRCKEVYKLNEQKNSKGPRAAAKANIRCTQPFEWRIFKRRDYKGKTYEKRQADHAGAVLSTLNFTVMCGFPAAAAQRASEPQVLRNAVANLASHADVAPRLAALVPQAPVPLGAGTMHAPMKPSCRA